MAVLQERSTITAKGQTTVPVAVRRALGVKSGDQVLYRVEDGAVTLQRVDPTQDDPLIERFLAFLEADLTERPDRLRPVTPELLARLTALTAGVEVEVDAAIEGEVAL